MHTDKAGCAIHLVLIHRCQCIGGKTDPCKGSVLPLPSINRIGKEVSISRLLLGTRVVVDAAINTSPFWSEIIIFAHERHPSCVFLNNPVCNHPLAEGTQLLKQNWLHAK